MQVLVLVLWLPFILLDSELYYSLFKWFVKNVMS